MPSASPESRSRKRHRSRSRSPKTRKRSSDDKEIKKSVADRNSSRRSKDRKEMSRSHSKRHRSRDMHKQSTSEEKAAHAKERRKTPDREGKTNQEGRHSQGPRLEEVRVKQEPLSDDDNDDEERRRKRRERRERETQIRPVKREKEEGASGSSGTKAATEQPKDKPNFGLSGKLAEDTNVYNGIVIKYNEPVEAKKPNKKWRIYPFKGDQPLPMLPIHRQSAYLLGRERRVADIPIDHPSCSKQHAVLQFRMISYKREDGSNGRRVRPYIIDLESANGTFVNNNRIEPRRYVELMEKDVLKFGFSSREYVLLHEGSVQNEDEVDPSEEPPPSVQTS